MLDFNRIVSALSPLVGWRKGSIALDEAITESESGLYYQEAHPLLTTRAMQSIMPGDFVYNYDSYKQDKAYGKGSKVNYNGKAYISLVDGNVLSPIEGQWEEYPMISDYLRYLAEVGIKDVVKKFVSEKVVNYETKNIIDREMFFEGSGNINARVANQGKLVGFEITPERSGGAILRADKVGLQFVGNKGKVKLYLFHSSESEPVWVKECNYTAENGRMQWFDLDDTFFSYLREGKGGSWYLCYSQDELPDYMEAVNYQRDWSKGGCSSCNKGNAATWAKINQWATISPFYVADFDGKMWDEGEAVYVSSNNYGLNLMVSMGCDLTDIIVSNREQFAPCIQLQVAVNALRTLVYNPEVRVNRVQVNADANDIFYALDGDGHSVKGLTHRLAQEYKALEFSTQGVDKFCLTCSTKGIRMRAI